LAGVSQSKYIHATRSHQPWYLKFANSRGKKWLVEAMKDKAFALGFGAKIEPEEWRLDYDWKALAK